MRGRIRAAVLFAALCACSSAWAASVDIITQRAPGAVAGRYEWSLWISTAPGVVVDGVGLTVVNADSFAFNAANAAISVDDSGFFENPLGDGTDALAILSVLGQHLSAGSADRVLLGTFRSPSPYYTGSGYPFPNFGLQPGDDIFGFTALADPSIVIQDWALIAEVPPFGEGPPLPYLPEPRLFELASLALATLALLRTVRRRAA